PEFLQRILADQQLAIAQAGMEFFSHRDQEVAARVLSGARNDVTVVEANTTPQRADEIAAEVRHVLTEVRRGADDFERMTERALQICDETAAVRELVEMREFLRWLVR